jgi:hypothetical protein
VIVQEQFPRTIRDTPCVRCGHAHAGSDFYDGQPRCGEWMSEWLLTGASFWMCECPVWIEPPYRCRCGKTRLQPFPAWLNGVRACSFDCALSNPSSRLEGV